MTARLSEAFLRAGEFDKSIWDSHHTSQMARVMADVKKGLYPNFNCDFDKGAIAENARLKPLLIAAARVIDALESEPIEVVGSTKDGRPLHKWTKHERVDAALSALKAAIGGEHG